MPNLKTYPRQINLDDDLRSLEPTHARYMKDVRAYSSATSDALSLENIKSTVEKTYANKPVGTSKAIGSIAHEEKNDVYVFFWNDQANHHIVRYNSITGVCRIVLNNGILKFGRTSFITGFGITGSNPDETLLYWTDNNNQPRQINVRRAENHTDGNYTDGYPSVLTEEMIRWIKYAPVEAPTFVHKQDKTVVYNNLAEHIFKFKYRYVYRDGQYSAYSPESLYSFSEYQLNNGLFDARSDEYFNYLEMSVINGWEDVTKIEIIAQEVGKDSWVLVETLDADTARGTQTFKFYNDGVYPVANTEDARKLYDAVPIKARAAEYIANRAILGNASDGFDGVDQDTLNDNVTFGVQYDRRTSLNKTAILASTASGTITFTTNGLTPSLGDTFAIDATLGWFNVGSSAGATEAVYATYSAQTGDTISNVVDNLVSLLNASITGVSNSLGNVGSFSNIGNNIVYTFTISSSLESVIYNGSFQTENATSVPSYKAGAKHPHGIVYYDSANRSSTVQRPEDNAPYVQWFSERERTRGSALVDWRIGHTPPSWATHYRLVYGANKSVGNFLQYSGGYVDVNRNSDDAGSDQNIYITFRNFKGFEDSYKESTSALMDYSFSEGDRIRIMSYHDGSNRIAAASYLDFKVVGFEYLEEDETTNPIYNQANWPLNSYGWTLIVENPRVTGWDYTSVESSPQDNNWFRATANQSALFEIYNPINTQSVDELYYEVGEKYEISNPFLPNRSHQGERDQGESVSWSITSVDPALKGGIQLSVDTSGALLKLYTNDKFTFSGAGAPSGTYTIKEIRFDYTSEFWLIDTDATTANIGNDIVLSASHRFAGGRLQNGDVWYKPRKIQTGVFDEGGLFPRPSYYQFVEDYYANDKLVSNAWHKGRPQAFSEFAKREARKNTVWLSEPFFPDTKTNGLGAFNLSGGDQPFRDYDRSLGGIQRLVRRGDDLIMYQENKVSLIKVNKDTLTTGDGGELITLTSRVLSEQVTYAGDYGISKNPESFAQKDGRHYFVDIKRGKVMRLSGDGLTPISDYKISKLLDEKSREFMSVINSGNLKIYGGFDREHDEYIITFEEVVVGEVIIDGTPVGYRTPKITDDGNNLIIEAPLEPADNVPTTDIGGGNFVDVLQLESLTTDSTAFISKDNANLTIDGGEITTIVVRDSTNDTQATLDFQNSKIVIAKTNPSGNNLTLGSTDSITPFTIVFHERSNSWAGFRSHVSEGYATINYKFLGFKDGVWIHNDGVDYNSFYGNASVGSQVTLVFNGEPSKIKYFKSLSLEANSPLRAQSVDTELNDTSFGQDRFVEKEGYWYADIPRAESTANATNSNVIGLSTVGADNGATKVFNFPLAGRNLMIGDELFNATGDVSIGNITAIDYDTNTVTLDASVAVVVGVDFIYAVKSAKIEGEPIRGYAMEVQLLQDGDNVGDFLSMFSANANVVESKLTLD